MPSLSMVEASSPDYNGTSLIGRFNDNVWIVVKCVEGCTFRGGETGVSGGSREVVTVVGNKTVQRG